MSDIAYWCLVVACAAVVIPVLVMVWLTCWIADEDEQERQARHIEWMENQDGEGWE
jgi:hypothetical protein